MVTFYVVRHGYSLSNKDGTFTGQLDIALSDEGNKQAELVSDYILKNVKVDAIYSSDLSRAVNTVRKISDKTGIKIITDKRFRECYCGKWEGLKVSEVKEKYAEDYLIWQESTSNARCTDGESMLEVGKRAMEALEEIAKKHDGKNVVIATHGGVIKMMQCVWQGVSIDEINKLPWATNASVSTVTYEKGKYNLVSFSYDDYLGQLKTAMPKGI